MNQWINYDDKNWQSLWNSESFGRQWQGYWPKGSYGGAQRLEVGQWPKVSNVPFSNPWYPDSGTLQCSRTNPCPWGGPDNKGTVVTVNGVAQRRGMCINGRCDCPIGQSGPFCSGEAHRDAFGQVAWSTSQLGIPTYDPLQAFQEQW